jgi:hypothetical protein
MAVSRHYLGILTLEFPNEKLNVVTGKERNAGRPETIKTELSKNFMKVPLLSTLMEQ